MSGSGGDSQGADGAVEAARAAAKAAIEAELKPFMENLNKRLDKLTEAKESEIAAIKEAVKDSLAKDFLEAGAASLERKSGRREAAWSKGGLFTHAAHQEAVTLAMRKVHRLLEAKDMDQARKVLEDAMAFSEERTEDCALADIYGWETVNRSKAQPMVGVDKAKMLRKLKKEVDEEHERALKRQAKPAPAHGHSGGGDRNRPFWRDDRDDCDRTRDYRRGDRDRDRDDRYKGSGSGRSGTRRW